MLLLFILQIFKCDFALSLAPFIFEYMNTIRGKKQSKLNHSNGAFALLPYKFLIYTMNYFYRAEKIDFLLKKSENDGSREGGPDLPTKYHV